MMSLIQRSQINFLSFIQTEWAIIIKNPEFKGLLPQLTLKMKAKALNSSEFVSYLYFINIDQNQTSQSFQTQPKLTHVHCFLNVIGYSNLNYYKIPILVINQFKLERSEAQIMKTSAFKEGIEFHEEYHLLNPQIRSRRPIAQKRSSLNLNRVICHFTKNRILYFIALTAILICFIVLRVEFISFLWKYKRVPIIDSREEHYGSDSAIRNSPISYGLNEPSMEEQLMLAEEFNQQNKIPSSTDIQQAPIQYLNLPAIKNIQNNIYQTKEGKNKSQQKNVQNVITKQQTQFAKQLLSMNGQDTPTFSLLYDKERQYYESKYNLSQITTELPFCIVVPSYNNVEGNRHIKNMQSILMQEYSNYHVVFINDASTDDTGLQIEAFLNNQTIIPRDRYVIVKNTEQRRAMPNLRMAAFDYCKAEEIFLIVDGDDQLLGRQVLRLFNSIFQSKGVWFMYTNFLTIWKSVGISRSYPPAVIKNNKYRGYSFVTSHLRAFYTQLFRNIDEDDLKDNDGNYLKAANDVAICIPILQQSHEKVIYIPEITYYYNSNTGLNNHKLRLKEQKSNDNMLRMRKPYKPLKELFPTSTKLI